MALAHDQGLRGDCLMKKKTEGRKSYATVPLRLGKFFEFGSYKQTTQKKKIKFQDLPL
jgi:hypothetical protein